MLPDRERKRFESEVMGHTLRLYFAGPKIFKNAVPEEQVEKPQSEEDSKALDLAREILKVSTVRERICKAFLAVTDDVREVAKIVTAALIPLSVASHPVLPLDALVFAWIAIIVVRAGVKSFCDEQRAKPTTEP